ncbi:MAG TPA: hypothetical protein ENJ93_03775 [Chloroflexi bacterium]|nr:hypothetical protein [Chloroflexota bacterium]
MKRWMFVWVALAVTAVLSACAPTEESTAMTTINLPMGYIPDPQYAPFYVAVERGYFAEEGIDVAFDYSFETDGIALVGAGERPFAIVSGEQVILARAQELPVVYVLQWFQKYPIAVISKEEAGIERPSDLIGREVGLPGFFGATYVGYLGLLDANGIAPEEVTAVDIGFTQVESLLTDKTEAVVGYVNNEPIQLAAQSVPIHVLPVSDYIDMAANGIITNEETIANNPELAQGFVRAVLRGLEDTLADPDAAYEISKQYVEGLDDGRKPVLTASLDLWQADTLGLTNAQSWQNTHNVLLRAGLLDAPVSDLDAAYTNRFVK